ncbi:sugar phosphate isomerase/epimerase family protein [Larkinella soli]|uniref:sugar phosphate isomerase/epimerase family protein n=1 Tax=Larkinella soli TaxID=1770527 RepID=UPI000FFC44FC|nr:sugar phosphate isomerase/epimerase family protein [Larkinella soli]
MIQSCVTIALVPEIKTGPWIYWDDLEAGMAAAAELGFDAVELFTASADALDPDRVAALSERYGLKIAAVGTGAGKVLHGLTLTDPNPEIRRKATGFIRDMIGFGARLGAPAIIGSMQGNATPGIDRPQALAWMSEGLNELGAFAGKLGVKLIYEPLNRYETNLINHLGDGVDLLQSLETDRVTLLADLFHMNIEEASIPETIRTCATFIGHVHFADSNRRPVGFGHTEMGEIALALQEAGYDGYVSAEALPWPDPDQAARQTLNAFRHFFPTQRPNP